MNAESRAYYTALGKRINSWRRITGFTQGELARMLGASQQAVFAWEVAERRPSAYVLIQMAKAFRIDVEELMLGVHPERMPKRRLSPKAQRHAERLVALSKTQQRFLVRIIDALEERKTH